ncbi:helix-turn-helix transcriptional regulator [Kribbella jejuensis]|uniref:Regulatory LuxR family protein n=1 Tax=Kribbella jejuensis TaxID=236068 RepID=A0A542DA06_9ACTN|nr:LuxR C-terminal-related transcriptional regulator [Kribbella jejuensis]TQI99910.1 regulatory LuxR family protein [Kribbella jejuensis]
MTDLLGAAAVVGERVRLDVLRELVGLPSDEFLAAVDALVREGALVLAPDCGEAWFPSETVRRDAEAALPLAARADLRRRAAAALDDVEHWSAAVAVTPDPGERARLRLRLAKAAVRTGELKTAHAATTAAVAYARSSQDHGLLTEAALTLEPIGESTWDGDIHQWCTEALAHERSARLLARQSQAATYLGRWAEALATSEAALQEAPDDTEVLTARQLATSGPDDVEELAATADRMIELGTSTGRADVELRGRLWRVDALWYTGDLTAIATEIARIDSCAGRLNEPQGHWHVLMTRTSLALARAEFDHAAALLDQALHGFREIGHPAVHGAEIATKMLIGHHCGHTAELLSTEAWQFGTDVRWDFGARLVRAFVLADAGRIDEAATVYQRCGRPGSWPRMRAAELLLEAIAARVAAAVGATEDVRELRAELDSRRGRYVVGGAGGTNFLGPVELSLGICAAALGDWDAAIAELTEAEQLCRAIGAPGFAVESACLLTTAYQQAGHSARAKALAAETLPLARTLGMTPWVARLQPSKLSHREYEVAKLVAAGMSNREIANALVISERTAQNHVQHILTKLDFANRAQIAAWMSSQ